MASTPTEVTAPRPSQRALRPPLSPWRPLPARTGPYGYVSTYLSDSLGRYPVRAVTKPRDNKSDPNIETGTYGMFSTCQIRMRKSIVQKGVPLIFFVSTHRGGRILSGYYEVAWYTPGPDQDYALAAKTWRFVAPIIAETIIGSSQQAVKVRRGYMGLDEQQARQLRRLIDESLDLTATYTREIARLEQLSARHTGYCYPTWGRTDGWSWEDAATYLVAPPTQSSRPVLNKAPGDLWVCNVCSRRSISIARLKRCPHCGAVLTLRPQEVQPL